MVIPVSWSHFILKWAYGPNLKIKIEGEKKRGRGRGPEGMDFRERVLLLRRSSWKGTDSLSLDIVVTERNNRNWQPSYGADSNCVRGSLAD